MLLSIAKSIDKNIFKNVLSKFYRIVRANLYVRSSSFLTYVPVSWIQNIDIEPIARCNLKCPFCQVPGWQRSHETGVMGIELFKKIIDQFPNLKNIKLQGMGEPFLNKNLTAMIRMVSDRNIETTIFTNGTLLDQSLGLEVLESQLSKLYFSFDAAGKQSYESLRVGANYEDVVRNIRNICEMKKKGRYKTDIYIRCLVSNQLVLDELASLVELAADVGVDGLQVAVRLKIWGTKDSKTCPVECFAIDSHENYQESIRRAEKKARELGVNLVIEQNSQHNRLHPCFTPWRTLFISVEGKVVPCSNIGSPDTWCMGDLNDNVIHEVWNNESYLNLRRSIRLNNIPVFCSTCYTNSKRPVD